MRNHAVSMYSITGSQVPSLRNPQLTARLEQLTLNQRVPGSALVRPPTKSNTYNGISLLIAFTKSACTQRCTRFGSSLPKMFEFCLPTKSSIVPTGPDWSQVQRLPAVAGARPRSNAINRCGPLIRPAAVLSRFLLAFLALITGAKCDRHIEASRGLHGI